ncbi:SNF2-related protein [Aquabacterium sp.]|uniref:SNF2-related protein n=1 Tax=Aquabacterium sp. TaxID=1872578 RepID=UPI004037888E
MSKPFTPRPYQGHIIGHILDVDRCAVWAGMGMGKTSSTLSAVRDLQMVESNPVLVLAPKRVAMSTWPDEARKWDHLAGMQIMPVVGSAEERRLALKHDAPVYTTNYENLEWLVDHLGDRWPFETVIADEATRLKSFRLRQGGVRARALGKVAHTKVKRFVELTGTPSPNGLQDLWGQTWFLDAGARLGRTFDAFNKRWFRPAPDGFGTLPFDHSQGEIQAKLRDLCLTVEAKDWFDLREPIVTNIYVDLPIKARRLYRDMEKQMFMEIGEHKVEAFGAAARTIKCLQIANGAAYVGEDTSKWEEVHDAKLQALESIIEEAGGMPVLVAYQFKSDLARLLKAFKKGKHLDADPQTIRDWNAGKIPVLFAHPASAGHGLNLQDGGNILAFFGFDWNLENRLQIIERIGPTRQMQAGHDRPMFIYNIVARDTVDELVLKRVETKREVQDLLLEAMKLKGIK